MPVEILHFIVVTPSLSVFLLKYITRGELGSGVCYIFLRDFQGAARGQKRKGFKFTF